MKNTKKLYSIIPAFTLVELIVVIVILAILATIAFLSFNSYSSSSRDSVRLADITNIAKGLTLQYTVGGYYIIPDNAVNLYSGSILIGYQGKAGSNTLNTIKLSANTNNTSGRDPIDNTYYTYNTNINKNRYQVTGYLENKGTIINRTSYINNNNGLLSFGLKGNGVEESINSVIPAEAGIFHILSYIKNDYLKDISTTLRSVQYDNNLFQINQTCATTYTNRFPYLKGDSIGVILNYTGTTSNPIYTPIEDITTSTGIDISSGTLTNGKIVISNNTDSFTGVSVISMSGYIATVRTSDIILSSTGKDVLLMHFDGINNSVIFNDNLSPAKIISSFGDSKITTSQSKFGGASGYFDGNQDYLSIPYNSDFDFGTGDFTIDFWVNPQNIYLNENGIISGYGNGSGWLVYMYNNASDSISGISFYSGPTLITLIHISKLTQGSWQHIAFERDNNIVKGFLNGSLIDQKSYTGIINVNPSFPLVIGRSYQNLDRSYFYGYIDELRISKGIARRTGSTFSVPNSPY